MIPNEDDSPGRNRAEHTTLGVYSAYELPSVAALVRYFHAYTGYPVISTWLNAIKAGNYMSWTGLTYNNEARYCPSSDKTIKGHMVMTRQGIRSTRKLLHKPPETPDTVPSKEQADKATQESGSQSNELHIHEMHTSKLYTDDNGRFHMR